MWQEGFMIHLTLQSLNPSPKAVGVLDKPNSEPSSEQDQEFDGDAQWRNVFISSGGTQCWCPCIVFYLHPEHVSFWRYLPKEQQKEEQCGIARQKQNCRSEARRGGHNSKNRGWVATLGNRDHQSLSSVSNFCSHKAFKMKSRCLLTGLRLPRLLLSCLFPKRPMGRTPRPTYQKGSISGPAIQSIQWGCTTALGDSASWTSWGC